MNRVFVLGAGASAHAGAPLGNNILKKYIELRLNKLEKEKVALSSHGKNSFITPILGNFETLNHILLTQPNCRFTNLTLLDDLKEENLPNIEDVFTLYDIAYQKDEPLFYEADIDLNIIRKDILDLLTYTIVNSTKGAMNRSNTTDIRSFKRDSNEIGHVGSFVLYDTTGEIRIILWDDQVNVLKDSRFGKNGLVKIVNAYAKVGRSEDLELHVGKLGNVILPPDDVDSSKYPILKERPIQIGNIDLTTTY